MLFGGRVDLVSKGPFCQKIRASLIFARSPQRRRHFWAKHWQKFLLIGPGTKNQHSAMEFPEFDFCAKVYRSANKSLFNWEDQMEKHPPVSWPCPWKYSPARTLIDGEKTRIEISSRKSGTPAVRLEVDIAKGTTDPRVEFSFTKVACLGHITSSSTNLDHKFHLPESWPSVNLKISTKYQHLD